MNIRCLYKADIVAGDLAFLDGDLTMFVDGLAGYLGAIHMEFIGVLLRAKGCVELRRRPSAW